MAWATGKRRNQRQKWSSDKAKDVLNGEFVYLRPKTCVRAKAAKIPVCSKAAKLPWVEVAPVVRILLPKVRFPPANRRGVSALHAQCASGELSRGKGKNEAKAAGYRRTCLNATGPRLPSLAKSVPTARRSSFQQRGPIAESCNVQGAGCRQALQEAPVSSS